APRAGPHDRRERRGPVCVGALSQTGSGSISRAAERRSPIWQIEPDPAFDMLLIPCPWCGARNQVEFTYGGDATLRRPAPDAPEAAWVEYVYMRDNPRGPHAELWLHAAGCRRWIVVRR